MLGSLVIPFFVTALAFIDLQILLTVFFTWASIHVLHQITSSNDCYTAKRPVKRSLRDRVIDYGVVFSCLYPLAMPRMLDHKFQLAKTYIYVPHWATIGVIRWVQIIGAPRCSGRSSRSGSTRTCASTVRASSTGRVCC